MRETLSPLVEDAVKRSDADRYRKSFPASAHARMLLLHAMSSNTSLRQSHAQQQADPALRRRLGMEGGWVSFSQLARSSSSRPAGCFEELLARVVRVAKGAPDPGHLPKPLGNVAVLDSTCFSLSRKLSPWSKHKGFAPGVRLQAELDAARAIPPSDPREPRAHPLGDQRPGGLEGVGPLGSSGLDARVRPRLLRPRPLREAARGGGELRHPPAGAGLLPDALGGPPLGRPQDRPGGRGPLRRAVDLGSPNNRTGAVLGNVRLVTSETIGGEVHRLVTDRHDLPAEEVVALYRRRWQIELFFRWLKRQLGALRAFGTSREAVWLTILVCAIVAVVAMLSEAHRPNGTTRVSWLRALRQALPAELRLSG